MNATADNATPLPLGMELDHFILDDILGDGGFSIVYRAHHASDKTPVIIKEYMPKKLAHRINGNTITPRSEMSQDAFNKGRKLFFQEASTLATLKHPNIVDVINFFQDNGTAYMVMRFEEGVNLQTYIRKREGGLSEALLRKVFPGVLEGLKMIHEQGLLHLDIKPGNIHLRQGGRPLLLDFGAVRERNQSRMYESRVVSTAGFAPMEQITERGYMGPWTDIYAVGATMRSCIEGVSPPAANDRKHHDPMKPAVEAFKRNYSQEILALIDWAMEVDQRARPQKADELLQKLHALPPLENKPKEKKSLLTRLGETITRRSS